MICINCGKNHGDREPTGCHTVTKGICPFCKKKGLLWPDRHFFSSGVAKLNRQGFKNMGNNINSPTIP